MMFKFSRKEVGAIVAILTLITLATYLNIRISFRNDRDVIRNLDISKIAVGVEKYRSEYGTYPLSDASGNILACRGGQTTTIRDKTGKPFMEPGAKKNKLINLAPCIWGVDFLGDIDDINYPKYLDIIPNDPQEKKGVSYFYESDGQSYKIYASYEGRLIADYSREIIQKNIKCGIRLCNVGRTVGAKPI